MTLSGGDRLAKGAKAAQFSAGTADKDAPVELKNVAPEEETFGVTVVDRRPSYLDNVLQSAEPVKPVEFKYPEKEYGPFKPILDRLLVKNVSLDKNLEVLEDGSVRDKRTNFIIPAKYRQHDNTGVVLAIGNFMVTGGVRIPMEELVKPGDIVTFGDYNTEKVILPELEVRVLCDAIQHNFDSTEDLSLVYVQNIRSVRSPVVKNE